jgi:hypothetical protein
VKTFISKGPLRAITCSSGLLEGLFTATAGQRWETTKFTYEFSNGIPVVK